MSTDNTAVPAASADAPVVPVGEGLVESGILTGYLVHTPCFIPTMHMRIARHTGKWPDGSNGKRLPDRLQQAWVDQFSPSVIEWRDVPVVEFDTMPTLVVTS